MSRLQNRSELAYKTIQKIFQDPYAEVTTTTLNKLAPALGVETQELLENVPEDADLIL